MPPASPRNIVAASAQRTLARHQKKLSVIAAAIIYVLQYLRWRFGRSRPRGVPFFGHWLCGSTLPVLQAAMRNEIHKFLLGVRQKLGQTFVVVPMLGPQQWTVMTANPANVEHILKKNFDNYPKGWKIRNRLSDLLGQGIFNVDGHDWYHQRKTTSQMFTAKLFKDHIWVVVQRNARKLRNILETVEPDKPVDVFNLMNRFTLDTIGEIGFGKCIGSLEDPASPFLRSFDRAQQICVYRFIIPIWRLLRWLRVGCERETVEHFSRLDAYSRTVVRELQGSFARDNTKNNGVAWGDLEGNKSFVGLFLADALKRGERVSETYLRDLVLNFLIAGRDTTAQALSWTIFCLCSHPEVEAKARQEVSDVCGARGPAYEDLNRLPYMNAVLSEALRLYPSVPIDIKLALEDDVWPDGTKIPAGTNIVYNIYTMGRDPLIWGPDAEEFRPERWLEMSSAPDNYHYPVFNGGPRECLGRRLAMVEMKTCLAMLLPHVTLKLAVPAESICTDSQLTIGMGAGLPCFVACNAGSEDAKSSASTAAQSDCADALSEHASAPGDFEQTVIEGM